MHYPQFPSNKKSSKLRPRLKLKSGPSVPRTTGRSRDTDGVSMEFCADCTLLSAPFTCGSWPTQAFRPHLLAQFPQPNQYPISQLEIPLNPRHVCRRLTCFTIRQLYYNTPMPRNQVICAMCHTWHDKSLPVHIHIQSTYTFPPRLTYNPHQG